jgi:flagellar protein FlbD
MIQVTRLNGSRVVVNALLIEMVEATPDTVITLTTGNKLVVRESVQDVIGLVTDYIRLAGAFAMQARSQGLEDTK